MVSTASLMMRRDCWAIVHKLIRLVTLSLLFVCLFFLLLFLPVMNWFPLFVIFHCSVVLFLCCRYVQLLDLMTARETLWFFGRIRGIPPEILCHRVDALIEHVGLAAYADKICGHYSGGNKRKLSLAVALIGDPKVLLLDEPSSGMDPEARRQMWSVIGSVSNARTVILTTHSMEVK